MRTLLSAALVLSALAVPLASGCGTTASSTDAGASADATATTTPPPGDAATPDTGVRDDGGLVDGSRPDDGGADAGQECGGKTCAPGDVCTRTYTTGGACLACPDGGGCPTGRTCSGGCCVPTTVTYTYACAPTPAGCAAGLSCGACGTTLCNAGCPCESAAGSTATCHCLAP
ncbi:MAG TPA: hypothetical protein PLR99_05510 [Polyangiaceae bacterium]|nr:hypothetical protein [Polyangiaceae bacterium]